MSDDTPPWAYQQPEIHPHDPRRIEQAEIERARLEEILQPWLADGGVEHVGSTSVPGLAAKPVIDLMAQVRDLDAVVDQAGEKVIWPATRFRGRRKRRTSCWPSTFLERHLCSMTISISKCAAGSAPRASHFLTKTTRRAWPYSMGQSRSTVLTVTCITPWASHSSEQSGTRMQVEEAEVSFRESILLDPYWAYPRHNLALAYHWLGDDNEARRSYHEAIQFADYYGMDCGISHHNRGVLLRESCGGMKPRRTFAMRAGNSINTGLFSRKLSSKPTPTVVPTAPAGPPNAERSRCAMKRKQTTRWGRFTRRGAGLKPPLPSTTRLFVWFPISSRRNTIWQL